tara:strand:- start:15210 stop:16559 length:1350 start_codon:yes stop_codon:yes gene_type:complete
MTVEAHDWQRDHINKLCFAINRFNVAVDASDMGTGKTIMALIAAKELGLYPVVVCPKSVISSWKRWIKDILGDIEPVVYNYEKLTRGNLTMHVERRGDRFAWLLDKSKVMIIFDEVHKCKGEKSLNSKLLASAKRDNIKTLMLSGTACSDPRDMKAIGYALGLHGYRDHWTWCLKHGCRKGWFGGLDFSGSPNVLKRLHDDIFVTGRLGSRIKISDLPEGTFPDNQLIVESFNLEGDSAYDINEAYSIMSDELERLQEVIDDSDMDSPLVIQLRARQQVELLKVPTFLELINNGLSEGKSVAVFVNFRDTLEAISSKLDVPVSLVMGGQEDRDRDEAVASFQRNDSRVIVCMIQAGGVGLSLHDELGGHPRMSVVSPGFSAIEFRQALGRIHRSGSQSKAVQYVVFAADTVEDCVRRAVQSKLTNLDMLNDGDLSDPMFGAVNYEEYDV